MSLVREVELFDRVRHLLEIDATQASSDEIHSVKSLLYASIERLGISLERLSYSQRLLRELLQIITMHPDLKSHEQRLGLQILEELSQGCNVED